MTDREETFQGTHGDRGDLVPHHVVHKPASPPQSDRGSGGDSNQSAGGDSSQQE